MIRFMMRFKITVQMILYMVAMEWYNILSFLAGYPYKTNKPYTAAFGKISILLYYYKKEAASTKVFA